MNHQAIADQLSNDTAYLIALGSNDIESMAFIFRAYGFKATISTILDHFDFFSNKEEPIDISAEW